MNVVYILTTYLKQRKTKIDVFVIAMNTEHFCIWQQIRSEVTERDCLRRDLN